MKKAICILQIFCVLLFMTSCAQIPEMSSNEPPKSLSGEMASIPGSNEPESRQSENNRPDNDDSQNEESSQQPDSEPPAVYMTSDISPQGLTAVYEALGAEPQGKIAVKIASGEPGSNYLRPKLIGDFVKSFDDVALVECNTIYGRFRTATAMHYQTAEDHGYLEIADFDVMDEDGYMTLPVEGGTNISENYVGTHFENYNYFIVLSHFKGHSMAGFGGAIKNASIGIASSRGKSNIHGNGFIEAMAEAAKSVSDALEGNILYINVMNRLSLDCDCEEDPREPEIHDIGILASFDPVALDQACVDLVYQAESSESLVAQIERLNGLHTLEHGEEIGLGSRTYQLVNID